MALPVVAVAVSAGGRRRMFACALSVVKMAAKGKFSSDTQARIVEALEHGATYELASHYAGITYETFRTWLASKPAFSDAVKAAEGKAAMTWLKLIDSAAVDNWQAAAWKLERRYPSMYGRQVQEHQGAVKIDVRYVNDWRTGGDDGERNA